MANSINDYESKAREMFDALTCDPATPGCNSTTTLFNANPGYWDTGCVFDTLLDYMRFCVDKGTMSDNQAQYVVSKIKGVYDNSFMVHGCWYDDYAWWSIAACKAFDPAYDRVFGPLKGDFQTVAMDCWSTVNTGKPCYGMGKSNHGTTLAYEKCDQDVFKSVKPKFDGGAWQYDILDTIPSDTSECVDTVLTPINLPGAPAVMLGPYQLSVMTGLYMILTQRLASLGKIDDSFTQSIYGFINNWVNNPSLTKYQTLMNRFDTDNIGIIRERVGIYEDGSLVNFYFNGEPAWAGDQGLFMGGLLDFAQAHPDMKNEALDIAIKVLKGTLTKMKHSGGQFDNVLHYWYPVETSPDNAPLPFGADPGDYTSGLGVLFRNILYCCQRSEMMKEVITRNSFNMATVSLTVVAAYEDQLPPVKNINPIFAVFNRLAILNFAIQSGIPVGNVEQSC